MSRHSGNHAIVIGGGIAGLVTAVALAGQFELVTLLERDEFVYAPAPRPGTPQLSVPHGLLAGGLRALNDLLPGFGQDLAAAGAARIRIGSDIRSEVPGFDPMPQRDFGWTGYTMSWPLLEHALRARVQKLANVMLLDECRATELLLDDGGSVVGVRCAVADGKVRTLRGELVIDASARHSLISPLLDALNIPQPETTEISIDTSYTMMSFKCGVRTGDWNLAMTFPDPRVSGNTGYLYRIEGGHWLALVTQQHASLSPGSPEDFMELTRQVRTSTIHDAIKDATPVDGKVSRFLFANSTWSHYERLAAFPEGLLPIGNTICRFDPLCGQGMTAAIKQALVLRDLLRKRADHALPLEGLAPAYFAAVAPLIAGARSMASVPDLAGASSPADFAKSLGFAGALMHLAARDPEIHRILTGVRHMVMPHAALRDPDLVQRVQMDMANA